MGMLLSIGEKNFSLSISICIILLVVLVIIYNKMDK